MSKLSLASVLSSSSSVCFVCFAVLRRSMVSVFSFSTHCWGLWASATTTTTATPSSTWLLGLIKCCQRRRRRRRRWTWSSISFCLAVQIWKNNNLFPLLSPLCCAPGNHSRPSASVSSASSSTSQVFRVKIHEKKQPKKMRNGNAGQKLRRISVRRKSLPVLPAQLGYSSSLSYSRHIRRHERVQLLFATKSCQYAEKQRALSFKIL